MTDPADAPVLVVDDNLLFSSGILTALRRLGLPAAVADAPAQVAARARELRPRAILINLSSRSLQSTDRVRELKADAGLQAIPIVGYCGHTETDLITAGRAAGCDVVVANSAVSGSLDDVLRRAGVLE